MNFNCPNTNCQNRTNVIKDGSFYRKNDSRIIQRFRCKNCGKRFSSETYKLEYRQKKRRVNYPLMKLLCSGVSMSRAAIILNINPKTVDRKLKYLAKKARVKNSRYLKNREKVNHLIFDI